MTKKCRIFLMEITYLGHSSFKIRSKSTTLVTDPFSPSMVGLKFPKIEADIVTVSHQHQDHNYLAGVSGEPFVITEPGEYEVKGISIFGYPSFHDSQSGEKRGKNTIFVIEAEGLRICHLGDLGSTLSPKELEEINGVEVLMVPVGGIYTIGPKEATEVIAQVEPLIVLPMHFKARSVDEKNFGALATIDVFLNNIGVPNPEKLDKLSLTKDKLPQEMKVVVLEKKE